MSSPHLVTPTPIYAAQSPQHSILTQSALAYPSAGVFTAGTSAAHAQSPTLGLAERTLSPPPAHGSFPRPVYAPISDSGHGTVLSGGGGGGGHPDVVSEMDPSANLAELEGKLSVGIDFGYVKTSPRIRLLRLIRF